MKRRLFVALLLAGVAIGAACSLNPQPLPPESGFAAADGGPAEEGGAGGGANDMGPSSDGSAKRDDAGSDATTVPGMDAGLDAPSDAPNDAPSDAPSDGREDT